MNWIRVSIFTTPQGLEPLFGALLSIGIEGAEIVDEGDFLSFLENNKDKWDYVDDEMLASKKCQSHINVFLRDDSDGADQLTLLRECLARLKTKDIGVDMGSLSLEFQDVPEDLWFEKWKKYYVPTPIGERILVVPAWENPPETDRKILRINPGMLFGTGTHNTTRLCMQQLEKTAGEGKSVLDIGCGSGILSIMCLVLGADKAAAVDIDPAAVHVAYENAALNGIGRDRYFVTSGNVLEDNCPAGIVGQYDIVVANIVADVIIPLCEKVDAYLKRGALFLCSGIIESRIEDVRAALAENGFEIISEHRDGEWYAVNSRKRL